MYTTRKFCGGGSRPSVLRALSTLCNVAQKAQAVVRGA